MPGRSGLPGKIVHHDPGIERGVRLERALRVVEQIGDPLDQLERIDHLAPDRAGRVRRARLDDHQLDLGDRAGHRMDCAGGVVEQLAVALGLDRDARPVLRS